MINKNEEYVVEILDNGIDGEGIAKIDGYTIFIDGAIKGEKVKTLIVKANRTFGYGKILEIIEKSPERVEPFCPVYKKCGGCALQHMSYEAQMRYKEEKVKKTLEKFLGRTKRDVLSCPEIQNQTKKVVPFCPKLSQSLAWEFRTIIEIRHSILVKME